MNRLDERLQQQAGEPLLGVSILGYQPEFVEMAAYLGFGVLWVEMEHGPMSFREAGDLCRIGSGLGMLTMIRIPEATRENVLHAAECGPDILDLPMADTPEIAANLVRHARYSPEGDRGCFAASRATRYGLFDDMAAHQRAVNDSLCLMIQIETRQALGRVEELAQVPGIDALFIGPSDLASSLGVTGQTDHQLVREAGARIIAAAHAQGKRVAMAVAPHTASAWARRGVDLLFCGSDIVAMRMGLQGMLKAARTPEE